MRNPAIKGLLVAAALGLLVGGGAALGWATVSPEAEGWFTCMAFLCGVSYWMRWGRK